MTLGVSNVRILAVALLSLALLAPAGHAGISLIDTRVALGADDYIDWGQLGSPRQYTITSPQNVYDALGNLDAVSDSGSLARLDEGTGWHGMFLVGQHLLWNNDNHNPIVVAFLHPVFGFAVQAMNDAPGPFRATVSLFNGANNLANFFVDGVNVYNAENGTAPVLGALDTVAEITSIRIIAHTTEIINGLVTECR